MNGPHCVSFRFSGFLTSVVFNRLCHLNSDVCVTHAAFRAWGKQVAGSSLEAPDRMGLAGRAWPTAVEPGKVSSCLGSAQVSFRQMNADEMILIFKMRFPHPYYCSELAFLSSQGVPGQYPVMHNFQRQTSPCQSWPQGPQAYPFPCGRPFSMPQQPLL